MSDVMAAIIARMRALEARLAALERRETTPATSSDTYNASVANLLKSATDGGLRLDHLDLGNITDAAEGELRAAANVRASGFFYLGPVTTLTIASGVVTATGSYHAVDTEGGTDSDDLDAIYGGGNGAILILRSANSGRDVTLREGVGGNLALAGNFTLSTIEDRIMLIQHSGTWYEISRSDNS